MKERIVQFIESENITAAEFADNIGVQRSSVSHVLNGRNNPGFSFIQKILETYPKINSRWLLLGEGEMYQNFKQEIKPSSVQQNLFDVKNTEGSIQSTAINKSIKTEAKQPTINPLTHERVSTIAKQVERVLIFYSDHTFDDYTPAK
jgi:transcriptional regulator with XRE-family HTH domain